MREEVRRNAAAVAEEVAMHLRVALDERGEVELRVGLQVVIQQVADGEEQVGRDVAGDHGVGFAFERALDHLAMKVGIPGVKFCRNSFISSRSRSKPG